MAIPIRVGQVGQSKSLVKTNRKSQDPRLWLGILFILAAMFIGQLVVSSASARVPAVTLNSNIAQGALIRESDVLRGAIELVVLHAHGMRADESFEAGDRNKGEAHTIHMRSRGARARHR